MGQLRALLAAVLAVMVMAGCGTLEGTAAVADPEETPAAAERAPAGATRAPAGAARAPAGAARAPAGAARAEATPRAAGPAPRAVPQAVAAYGVSAGHPAAVEAGMGVLAAGGNAVDAAIATAYAVGVAEPFGSGIGGGGAALVAEPGGYPVAYDYRDVVDQSGVIPVSEIGIPGLVAGMEALHERYGTVPLADLIAPAVAIATDGVETYEMLADQLRFAARRLPVDDLPHLYPGGRPLVVGEPLVQTELAATLQAIAEGGAATFYEGEIAAQLDASVDGIDVASLAAYEVKRREPVAGAFAGYEVVSAPPPLAGATLVQLLQVAETLGIADHAPGTADYVHALAMSWRLADRFRTWEMADPDFVDVPVEELTDAARNAALAGAVPADALLQVDQLPDDAGETTHLVVVDADGMMVSMTNTLTDLWGSGRYELGFFLNDQLSNFGIRLANEPPEPGKRAVSSTVPTIVLDAEGRPVLGLGSPGGGRIPLAVAQVLVRWALHGDDISAAVAAPRFHLAGSKLHLETGADAVADTLRGFGYAEVSGPPFSYYFGSVQAVEVDHDAGVLHGAADPRRAAAARVVALP